MGKVIDLTGQKFGEWTVLERDYEAQKQRNSSKAYWKCQCSCGLKRSVVGADLRNGKSTGCGKCGRVAHNFEDLTGKHFNFLTVIKRIENRYDKAYWLCQCDCGNTVEVSTSDIKNGYTKSCGCKKVERFKEVGMNSCKDLTGQQFGYLTVLSKTNERSGSNVRWLCRYVCEKEYTIAGGDLTSPNGIQSCGCVSITKGERIISQNLDSLKIKYELQKTFNDCRNPKTNALLRYDFYLPDYKILIEYDGIQHFQEVPYFRDSLEEVQFRDNYKDNYAKEHNYKLLRIPYTDLSLITEKYLQQKLQEVIIYGQVYFRIRPKY